MKTTRIVLVLSLLLVLVFSPLSAPRAERHQATLRHPAVAWAQESGYWISEPIEEPVSIVGLTWKTDEPEEAYFRTKEGGRWGPWIRLHIADEHGPDPGTEEYDSSVPGTDEEWVGSKEGVQYRVRGGNPAELTAVMVNTIDVERPSRARLLDIFRPQRADGQLAQPTIRPRSEWDPTNSCEPRTSPTFTQVTHAIVHHTTGSNSYTRNQVPGRILGICLFHRDSRGWNDIAYNFLIDRFGNIWEGRAGGIDKGVQGGHAAGFNTFSTGVAFIGDHQTSAPTTAAQSALRDLLAWKFSVHNIDPTGRTSVVSHGSARYQRGERVSLRNISAHRDTQITACPGEACFARMDSFRSAVDGRWSQTPFDTYQAPLVGDFTGNGQPEAAIYRPATGEWMVTQQSGSGFTTTTWATWSARSGWAVHLVGDFIGNGRDDIASYRPSTGSWTVNRSTGSRFVPSTWARWSANTGWTHHLVGDFTGNGRDDIASYRPSTGNWTVNRSTGSSFSPSTWARWSANTGWTHHLVGDFTGNGRYDIASYRQSTGNWTVNRSTGGRFSPSTWARFQTLDHLSHAWAQDVNSNGRADVLAFDAHNGTIRRFVSGGSSFSFATIDNTPWRTTLAGQYARPFTGGSSWVFFNQEFQWIRLTGLHTSSASSIVADSLPRP